MSKRSAIENIYPLAPLQEGMLFHALFAPESGVYVGQFGFVLEGPLNVQALDQAWQGAVARHEALRAAFAWEGVPHPMQVIRREARVPLRVEDWRGLDEAAQQVRLGEYLAHDRVQDFDLKRPPLMRLALFRVAEEEHQLVWTHHHLILDGWSLSLLFRDVLGFYSAYAEGATPQVGTGRRYGDYVAWLAQQDRGRAEAFWRGALAGFDTPTPLPGVRAQAGEGRGHGAAKLALTHERTRALQEQARRWGVTPGTVVQGAWALLLSRYTGEEDVVFGATVSGRPPELPGAEEAVGLFINTLPVRVRLEPEAPLEEWLGRLQREQVEAREYEYAPLAQVQKWGEVPAGEGLFESLVVFENYPIDQAVRELASRPGGLRVRTTRGIEQSNYPLVVVARSGAELTVEIRYDRSRVDDEVAERLAGHLEALLEAVAEHPGRRLSGLSLLRPGERAELLAPHGAAAFPQACVHELFAWQAERTADAAAVVYEGETLTYAELERAANRLAHHLRARGVGPESRVAVCAERSAELVVALLGVLKAGGAYVPLDPSYPRERLGHVVRDAGLRVAVAGERQRALLPEGVDVVAADGEDGGAPAGDALSRPPSPENLAYVIYTSGSTGTPKGVGVTHRNALSFFAAMDERVGGGPGTWMAVTSMSFDISVLELLWTLSRGFRVVVHPDGGAAPARARRSTRPVEFSLFYFASAGGDAADGYRLLMEGAKFADRNGFAAVWTPERHFHAFGGLYPNPSVTGAAVAAVTERVGIRAGSVVLPLHPPVRVAEEWAVVDVLSRGRVGISFASGWHADDFVLAPGSYADRKEVMLRGIEEVRGLWRGEAVRMVGGAGDEVEVRTLPRPVQAELPVWITSAGSPETFEAAGERGYNVLTHLLGQSVDELAARVALYRDALRRHGRDPESGRVTLMLHTFVGPSEEEVRATVREPFKRYLASSVGLIRGLARSMGVADFDALAPEDMDALLEHAFERYYGSAGLMGTEEQCLATVDRLREAGVDELACLVDFGVETGAALAALERLDGVRRRAAEPAAEDGDDASLAAAIVRHGATHLQCTPSALRTVLPDEDAPRALGGLRRLLLGGEALPAPLAAEALAAGVGELHNMYGPTETTVWSATHRIRSADGGIAVGTPVANTRIHLVDRALEPVPVGVRGELLIGGEGVARGYLGRPDLTAERFVPDPFACPRTAGARLYRTGDLARRRPDGLLEVVGRADQQVKVRGHRVEPGEIEAALEAHPAVAEAAVAAREDAASGMPGERRLVAYLVAAPAAAVPSPAELRDWVRGRLPEYMVPAAFVALDRLPLTPNGKLDRRALPAPDASRRNGERPFAAPRTPAEAALAAVWADVLRVERVGVHDNFFESGGDSILAIQVVARAARAGVRVTPRQLFQHQTVAALAAVAGTAAAAAAEQGAVVGPVPLTPIQGWLLEQDLPDPHHYNQAVLLAPAEALDAALLARAVAALAVHHDALRLRFARTADGWSQASGPADCTAPFSVVDLAGVRADGLAARIEQAAAALQAGLDLARGPVFRVGLMECGAGSSQRVMIVVHHLAVDGISWRVLLEDLESAYRQLRAGEPARFPPKTTSFREWARRLAAYAGSDKLAAELPYWTDARRLDAAPIPVDRDGPDPEGGMREVSVRFTAEETRALLHEAPAAYRTGVNDFLLAALARALAAWTGGRRVLVSLEGHGREELFPGVDLSRTVGWFTSLVPLLLETDPGHGPGETLKSIKEQLRAVPERGVGHGVLRHLHPDPAVRARLAAIPAPGILFNYLGQLDGTVGGDALFRPAAESRGPDRSPRGPRGHRLEVTGMVFEGELRMDWMYGREVHERATVERVAERFAAELRALVAHCREPGAGGVTPSDFPLARLTQAELDARLGNGRGVEDVYPVTPMQEGLLFESLFAPGTGIYVSQLVVGLRGELDPEALERAWRSAAARHEVLRAGFQWEGLRRPLQVVRREARVPFRREDLRGLGAEEREAWIERYLEGDRREGFDLAEAPLMRVALLRTGEREHRMAWTHHHLVLDGWSLPVLLRDVLELYHAHRRGEPAAPGGARPYREFVSWLAARDLARSEEYWRTALAGFTAPTPLPGARAADRGGAAGQATVKRELPIALTGALQEQARRLGVTLGTVVQGAWALLLSRHVGEEEVVFGTTVAGRPAELEGVEEMVGLFINTLPVRARVEGAATLREWLRRLQAEQVEAREHEYAPLADVQRWSGAPAGEPLFESLVAFENYPMGAGTGGGEDGLRVSVDRSIQENGFPLVLTAVPGDRLALELRHDAGRVATETGRDLARQLETVLEGMAGDAGTRLAQLSLLRPDERARVLEAGRGGARPFAREALVHELVAARAAAAPDLAAVACGARTLTYGELDAASARLASRLRAAGVGPEMPVAVFLDRSAELGVALLAVLRAGGAFLPLDVAYPRERLEYLLEDSDARVVVTRSELAGRLPAGAAGVLCVDDGAPDPVDAPAAPRMGSDALAYLIYTSGSTGRPKAVMVSHRSLVCFIDGIRERIGYTPQDRVLQFASPAFDVMIEEVFPAWTSGACVVFPEGEAPGSPAELTRVLEEQRVTIAELPTAFWHEWVRQTVEDGDELPGTLRLVAMGSERVLPERLAQWAKLGRPLLHGYGLTETTVATTTVMLPAGEDGSRWPSVPIGVPLANAEAHVLDAGGEPVPEGVPGELYLGGEVLARGYRGHPALTAGRWVPHPFADAPGARLCRTGDRVRRLPDGNLEFLGRVDQQVKIRGFRIEPGEVEAVLGSHPAVGEAAVVVREDARGEKTLVGYVSAAAGERIAARELRAWLRERLPEHMVPGAIVALERLPLTPNGKVDRRALPAPEWSGGAEYAAPRTATEEVLAGIWAETLRLDRVGVEENFFALGGHSLLAMQVVSRVRRALGAELPLRTVFAEPTVAGLARRVDALRRAGAAAAPGLERVPRGGALPASFAQQRLWLVDRLDPGSPAYNLPFALRMRGALDTAALRASLDALVARHEALRTTLAEQGGVPVQVVHPAAPVALRELDLRGVPEAARQAEAGRLAAGEALRPFDLARGPLLRSTLLRVGDEEHVLLFTLHHVVSDGWSMQVLVREVSVLYGAFSRGGEPALPEPPVQYADYAVWQRAWLSGEVLEEQVGWWREHLAGAPPLLEAPTDRPRAAGRGAGAGTHALTLPAAASHGLRALSRSAGTTLFMTVLAGWQALLARYAGQDDVVVGTPVSGRTRAELEGLIGFFVNMLPLRADLSGDPSWTELLGRTRAAALGAFDHQELPFERLVEELGAERSLAHTPVFQATFALNRAGAEPALSLGGLELEPFESGPGAAKFDLELTVTDEPAALEATLAYREALFDAATAARMAGHLATLLEAMAADPRRRLSEVPLLRGAERVQVLETWNAAAPALPQACIHELFAVQAAGTPGAVAIVHGDASLTYAELDRAANQLAHVLRQHGVRPDVRVGVCLARSLEMVVAMLAILKAGGAYAMLDPQLPPARLALLLEDLAAPVVLSRAALRDRLPAGLDVLCVDAERERVTREPDTAPAVQVTPEHLCYVIYTSGSTGLPKGTEVPHRAIPGFFRGAEYARFDAEQVLLQHSSVSWDALTLELWPALLTGGRCVLYAGPSLDPEGLAREVERHGVTTLWLTAALFNLVVDTRPELLDGVRQVMTGGEAVSAAHLRRARERHPGVRLVNGYGPSECTVFTACHVVGGEVAGGEVPIGRPVGDRRVYVLDAWGEPVPTGVPGELHVGGPGVARGYLGQAELTATRFVPDAFSADAGARLYASGDRVRWLATGELEFLGRADAQVKIRGFRVEPGEVAAVLAAVPAVRESAVVVRDDAPGQKRLVAYFVVRPGIEVSTGELRAQLSARLPEYLVPSAFVALEALPLTPNGKLDRRALPAPEYGSEVRYVAPSTPAEEVLAGIWSEVLGVERVGGGDNFFELGGHSLLATQVVSRTRQAFGVEVPLRALFEAPTVAGLAAQIEVLRSAGTSAAPPIGRAPRDGALPLSFAQQRLWVVDRIEPGSTAYNVPGALRLRGELDVTALRASVDALVRRHETLRTTLQERDGAPVQVVHPAAPVKLVELDLRGLPGADRDIEAARLAAEESLLPFDLARGPLLRCTLLRLDDDDHVLCFTLHHVVTDGWSMDVLVREVSALYAAFSRGEEAHLPELPVQYADFAVWQREWLSGEVLDEQIGYWKDALAGAPPLLEIAVDRPRSAAQGTRAGMHSFVLPDTVAAGLRALSRREGATLFMTLLAAWQTLLVRYAGQEDVVVGTPIAGRTRVELEGLIGFFVNMLPMRGDLAGDPTWAALLGRVRETALGAYAHQHLPFERLVDELAVERSLTHAPVFQAIFALARAAVRDEGLSLGTVRLEPFGDPLEETKFDLSLRMVDEEDGLAGALIYRAALFEAATAARMASHLETLLESMASDSRQRLSEVPLLRGAEREQLLHAWNGADTGYTGELCLHELVHAQVLRTPDAPALRSGEQSLTYAELYARACRLANLLRGEGVGPEVRVAISMDPAPEAIVAVLGVMLAGGAYLPLDPELPAERRAYMIRDAAPTLLLTQASLADRLADCGLPLFRVDAEAGRIARESDEAPRTGVRPGNLAYVIYTSGSTGRPKGVLVEHGGVGNTVVELARVYGAGPGDRSLLFAPLHFDASVGDVFVGLTSGAELVVAPREAMLPGEDLLRLLKEQRITHLKTMPSALAATPVEPLPELRTLVTGGDVCPAEQVRRWAPGRRYFNGYGATEASIRNTSSAYTADVGDPPIGRAVANTQLYVLDAWLEPVPVGVAGELYIGGVGVARGYLGRPDLTAERFLPDPHRGVAGARLYRTGDVGRRRADGEIEFLGRADHQVKVRGYRVELGEIEAVLRTHERVRETVVLLREDVPGQPRLVAYVVPEAGPEPSPAELRAHVAEQVPEYMVPGAFVVMESVPLTASGKVDRRRLPAPESGTGEEHVEPRTPAEEVLAGIWAEVLGTERVSVEAGFFDLGGHSLLATQVVSRARQAFGVEVPLRALFEAPTVAGLARRIEALRGAGASPAPPIVPTPRDGAPLPVSFAQQRLWVVDRLEPGSPAYNMPYALRLRGALDTGALRAGLDALARRHETLRTTFAEHGGRPVQVVHPPAPVPLPVLDLRGLPEAAREGEALRLAAEEALRPFDLARGPLLRATLLRLGAADHVLCSTLHHVVSDGWSRGVLVREVSALYAAFRRGEPSPLPELEVQYADFAAWQRRWLSGEALDAQLGYWKERLSGAPPLLEVPTDHPRAVRQSPRAASHAVALPPGLSDGLRALSRRAGTTLFMTLLAGWQALLATYSGQEDVVVGSPVAGRTRRETEGLIGFFVNMLALRADVSGDPTWTGLLGRVHETALGAYAHQDLPFERLVEELGVERSLVHTPVFQATFALEQSAAGERLELGELGVAPFGAGGGAARFDLELVLADTGDGVGGALGYREALFEAATVARMAGHLQAVLEAMAAEPDGRLAGLALLSGAERARVLEAWNDTARPYPEGPCVHDLFAAQAARTPDAVAVSWRGERMTYADLDRRSARLANALRRRGVGPETRVGVCMSRTPELPVALLAVLRAGGAYVPLDPAYPRERLGWMLEDAGIGLVLTEPGLAGRLPESAAALLFIDVAAEECDVAPASGVHPENLSHVIFTSGSTGRPKGVMIRHASVAVLLHWLREIVSDEERRAVLFATSISFDVSVAELFGTLAWGGTVVLAENALELPALGEPVVYASMVPGAAAELLRSGGIPASVRTLNLAGEALPASLARGLYALGTVEKVGNLYGPTEDTTYSTHFLVERGADRVLIGGPAANTRAYVLDRRLEPVPVGVAGELYLAGDGLARGYQGRPDLSAERFLPDPFAPAGGARMYRVMDRARWTPGGELEYLGRTDFQVKLRGFRIEPGEIEAVLAELPRVREAVVVAREDAPGNRRLVAYVAADEGAGASRAELRAHLASRLPEYMVPADFVMLERLPRTGSGKLDRRALPAPVGGAADRAGACIAPRDHLEVTIAAIFAEVLGVARVGVRDSFFDLGGHSLLAVHLATRLGEATGVRVPAASLFAAPTVERLAEVVRRGGDGEMPLLVPVRARGSRTPLFLVHPVGGTVMAYAALASRLHPEQPVLALRSRGTEPGEEPGGTVEEVARGYLALVRAEQPAGPYRLGGWSMGGVVAFEMARQLEAAGEEVEALVLVDSRAPHLVAPHLAAPGDDLPLVRAFAEDLGIPADRLPAPDAESGDAGGAAYLGRVLEHARAAGLLPGGLDPARMGQLYGVFRSNLRALYEYRPGSYGGRATLLRAAEGGSGTRAGGWERVVRGGLEVRTVPGTHYTMVREPRVETLAAEVERALG
ncbi:MAG: non-ribosomal peptide synthase/polyketide synthase [Longimicrobiaceae bacterium]